MGIENLRRVKGLEKPKKETLKKSQLERLKRTAVEGQKAREREVLKQKARDEINKKIDKYIKDINFYKKRLQSDDKRYSSSRSKSISTNRIRARQESISFLQDALNNIDNLNLDKVDKVVDLADKLRLEKTRKLERERIKKEGLKPFTSTKKIKILKPEKRVKVKTTQLKIPKLEEKKRIQRSQKAMSNVSKILTNKQKAFLQAQLQSRLDPTKDFKRFDKFLTPTEQQRFESTLKPYRKQIKKAKVELDKSFSIIKIPENQNIINKVVTGQTVTPDEIKKYNNILKDNSDKISKEQFTLLKNAPKDIATGLYEVGKDFIVTGKDLVVGSYNYGKSLRKRFEKGENFPLFNDISKIAKGSVDVAKFVVNNPKKSASIVGIAAVSLGRDYLDDFLENPVKTVTKTSGYLFPGTIIKGGVKTAGLGVKGVKTVTQAKRLANLERKVSSLRKTITLRQNNKLDKLIGSLSKVSKSSQREERLNKFINSVAKDQNIKLKRGKDFKKKVKELKSKSKVIPIGKVKGVKASPLPKKQPKRPIKIFDIEKGIVRRVSKLPKEKPKRLRDTTKYFKVEDGEISKVTKGEFKKLEPQIIKKKQPKRPIKLIDLKGGKVTKISEKSPKLQSKNIFKSKKGQARIFRGSKSKIQQQVSIEVEKISKKVKKIRKLKKKPSKSLFNKLKKDLKILKKFINSANANKIGRFILLLKKVNSIFKDLSDIESISDKDFKKIPAQDQPQKKTQGTDQPQKRGQVQRSPSVFRRPQKSISKAIKKVSKKTIKKSPKRKIRTIKIPRFGDTLPKGYNIAVNIRIAGKIFPVREPINKASKRATTIVLRDKKLKKFDLIAVGLTKSKDILRPKALSKFKGKKGDRVYTYVQK